jgi:uncharacterized membrane protein
VLHRLAIGLVGSVQCSTVHTAQKRESIITLFMHQLPTGHPGNEYQFLLGSLVLAILVVVTMLELWKVRMGKSYCEKQVPFYSAAILASSVQVSFEGNLLNISLKLIINEF